MSDPRWNDAPFVETTVSQIICRVLDRARREKQCAAIIGSPGVGKTLALKEWMARHYIKSYLICTATIAGSMHNLFSDIASVLRVFHERGIAATHQALMRAHYSPGEILVLDEAQNLPNKHFRELLYIWDETGLPIVFCGNHDVLKQVNVDKGALTQISRRVPFREEIYGIEASDSDKLASCLGVEGMDAFRALRIIGERFHADGVVRAIQEARSFSEEHGTVRIEHIRDALESLPYLKRAFQTANRSQRIVLEPRR